MISEIENPDCVSGADIVVGIPSYNEADAISVPTQVASTGLAKYFPNASAVLINADNHSPDGTREAFLNTPTQVPKIYVSTPEGLKGKGRNVRNLFEVAAELQARTILTIDADLKSMKPNWIQHLCEPLFDGYDFVIPIYARHKYDGTITKNIAYPLLRTLYGLRVRQPIAGDFGISGKLARCLLVEKTWTEAVANFGIDIWITTIAICRHFNVCQTFMGSPKSHRPKDPADDLGPMFSQVVSTIFQLMMDFEFLWKDVFDSRPSVIYGFGLGQKQQPPEVRVNRQQLYESFQSGLTRYESIWTKVLTEQNREVVEGLKNVSCEHFYYASDVWARVLFDFAIAYGRGDIDREKLISVLVPFYYSRTLSFVNKSEKMDTEEAELYLENINRVFEEQKTYLLERWARCVKNQKGRVADFLRNSC